MVLASAFFTGVIGVHPIFGAFTVGLICPHDAGFAIKVTEKVEDLISAIFLPLYFALSGLNTNLGLLDSALVWAYVIGVIAVAFCGKFIGASLAARATGMVWRESFAIGSLMSCKGLVELIVLVRNIPKLCLKCLKGDLTIIRILGFKPRSLVAEHSPCSLSWL
jgi:Kef-type K+ transport system membrane component KefB